ncbi:MAG: 50S ribosomal protein L32 [Candidatus Omnitrophica bacterium]|nr:50S ribosomal protein L32 [Candidatus Omnitrophota bacterium]MBU1925641.1 50S ribosomal protein L32 [Candidatus Omnitrophota bacterium]MBU2064156.1 50S ribosomal protein L32 [Candidatus Omnitrophota bacterium]
MAHPKRKTSKTRRAKRRTHKKLDIPSISICPHCKQTKPPHQVCPHCGYYKGKKYREIKEKKPKK